MMTLGQAFGTGAQGIGDMYRTRMLADQLQTYPDLMQAQLQNAQATAGINQNTLNFAPQTSQAAINNTNAQSNQYNSNAKYINTESGLNQIKLNNPATTLAGIPGQLAGIAAAMRMDPSIMSGPSGAPAGASTTGQIMPPSNPNQGGLAQLNSGGMMSPNVPIMMQGVPGGGQMMPPSQPMMPPRGMGETPMGVQSGMGINPNQNAIQQQLPQNGQLFGGNPVANQMLNAMMLPLQQKQAETNYYLARTAQLAGQQDAGKNPMMGTNASGAGGTYINPLTGQQVSTDTTSQTSRDQRTIAGLSNAQQYLSNVVQQMPQFVTGSAKLANDVKGFSNSWLGTQYSSPSQLAAGEASINSAAEGILNGFGLNSTGGNVEFAKGIIEPAKGESPFWYQNRVLNQMSDFSDQVHRAQDRLGNGTNLTQQQIDQIDSDAAKSVLADPSSASKVFIPPFNNPAAFNQWYQKIPPEAQQQVTKQLAAQNAAQNPGNSSPMNDPSSGATPNATAAQAPMVTIMSPDGQRWNIPQTNLSAALKRGAKQVQ